MVPSPPITIEHLRELARRHGVGLDDARAADLLPRATSLIARLAGMAEQVEGPGRRKQLEYAVEEVAVVRVAGHPAPGAPRQVLPAEAIDQPGVFPAKSPVEVTAIMQVPIAVMLAAQEELLEEPEFLAGGRRLP